MGVTIHTSKQPYGPDMKIVTLGSSGIVLTSFRFLTSACHSWARTQRGLMMFHELKLRDEFKKKPGKISDIEQKGGRGVESNSLFLTY